MKVDCNLDFGLELGFPESIRRPRFEALEGLVYFLPRSGGDGDAAFGDVVVMVCLRDGDLERLRGDEVFSSYVEFIG